MKDIVIPAKSIHREKWILILCVALALLINVGAIIAYQSRWIELITAWHYTLGVALTLYFLTGLPRICWIGIQLIFKKRES